MSYFQGVVHIMTRVEEWGKGWGGGGIVVEVCMCHGVLPMGVPKSFKEKGPEERENILSNESPLEYCLLRRNYETNEIWCHGYAKSILITNINIWWRFYINLINYIIINNFINEK